MPLDLELVVPPDQVGTDIVSLELFKKHLRIFNAVQDQEFTDALNEAADNLHGPAGVLNRSVFQCTWVRYLPRFPACGKVLLPYPPVRGLVSITYEDAQGSSPSLELDPDLYVFRNGEQPMVPEIELVPRQRWPQTLAHPRAVAIVYEAGYEEFPPQLKRLLKILAADFIENKEATILDRLRSMTSRKTEFGVDYLFNTLRVPVAYDDWE
jgi:uncharacterized phiE125 gp8 family phage protein